MTTITPKDRLMIAAMLMSGMPLAISDDSLVVASMDAFNAADILIKTAGFTVNEGATVAHQMD